MKVLIAGLGNLGSHIARRLIKKHYEVYVWHYDEEKLKDLGKELPVSIVENITSWQGDIAFITVKDDAIRSVSELIPSDIVKVHCSGALPMDEISFSPKGVIYPLQSFIKTESVNWEEIPIFITFEPSSEHVIKQVAKTLSPVIYEVTDKKRLRIHLTAVIINNFVNFTLGMAKKYMSQENLSVNWFMPLLNKTIERFKSGKDPLVLQTGPARRNDLKTLDKHLELLIKSENKDLYDFYKTMSNIISHYYESKRKK